MTQVLTKISFFKEVFSSFFDDVDDDDDDDGCRRFHASCPKVCFISKLSVISLEEKIEKILVTR